MASSSNFLLTQKPIHWLPSGLPESAYVAPFFDIDLRSEREGGALWLRLTGREGTKQFIEADFGKWFKP
jgi:hypothetical protein